MALRSTSSAPPPPRKLLVFPESKEATIPLTSSVCQYVPLPLRQEDVPPTASEKPLRSTRRRVWKDRLTPFEIEQITTELSQILEEASESKDEALKPFWNPNLSSNYQRLWSPPFIPPDLASDYSQTVIRDGPSLDSHVNGTEAPENRSWFSIRATSYQIPSPPPHFTAPVAPISEVSKAGKLSRVTEKQAKKGKASRGPVKTLRIRLYPNPEEKMWIDEIHAQSRWFYNATHNICFKYYNQFLESKSISETEVRDLVKRHRYVPPKEEHQEGGPVPTKEFVYDASHKKWPLFPGKNLLSCHIPRGSAVMFTRDLNAALTNRREGNIRSFRMGYKSKKKSQTYTTYFEDKYFPARFRKIESKYCFTGRIEGRNKRVHTTFAEIFKTSPSPSGFTLEHDRLTDKHYILYTVPANWYPEQDRRHDSQVPSIDQENPSILSCDPGVRTFITGYDPRGRIIQFGDGANKEIYQMLSVIDELSSQLASKENPKRQENPETRKQFRLLWRKVKNRVRDLHWKTARLMVLHHDVILLPFFRASEMLRGRNISRITKRQMQALSFYEFQGKLRYLCKKYGRRLVMVEEDYTSRTCGACGGLNQGLKGSKVFTCPHCGAIFDRDENAARNILLKNLRHVSSL